MLRKIKKIIDFFWEKEFFRFLFSSGINTLVGWLVTLFWASVVGLKDPLPTILNFLCCFPLAYTLQSKLTFRQPWELKRMFAYATTSIPNMILQWIMTIILPASIGMPDWLRYAIINVAPLPVMFFVIRFVVSPMKSRKAKKEGKEE